MVKPEVVEPAEKEEVVVEAAEVKPAKKTRKSTKKKLNKRGEVDAF